MKRIAVVATFAASIMGLPSAASAATDCSRSDRTETVAGTTIGLSGSADITPRAVVGACLDNVAPAQGFFGGYAEAGVGEDPATGADDPNELPGGTDVYAIVDGDDANTFISTQGAGYFGLSNWETGNRGNCAGGTGTGTNSGGCFEIRLPILPPLGVPLLACGNTTGPDWANAGRDGCVVP